MKRAFVFITVIVLFLSGCSQPLSEVAERTEGSLTQTKSVIIDTPALPEATPVIKHDIDYMRIDETRSVTEFNLSESFFSNQYSNKINHPITCTRDSKGNYYYLSGNTIWKITTENTLEEYFLQSKVKSILPTDNESCFILLIGVFEANENIHAVVFIVYEDRTEFKIINIDNNEVLNIELHNLFLYHNGGVLERSNYNEKRNIDEYNYFSIKYNYHLRIDDKILDENERIYDILYSTDKMLVVTTKNLTDDEKNIIVIDIHNAKLLATLPYDELEIVDPKILGFEKDNILLYENSSSKLIKYDYTTGKIVTLFDFAEDTACLGYNPDTSTLFIRQPIGFTHSKDNLMQGVHDLFEDCIETNIENAFNLYFEFNIETLNSTLLNKIPLNEYIASEYTCLSSVVDYKIGDYIFTYYNSDSDTVLGYNLFSSKFKAGDEIDYLMWKE